MPKRSSMSPGEWDVARAVWEIGGGSVGQVYDEVSRRKPVDYATVQTYLRRLEAKGYLKAKRDGRNKIYSPRVSATQAIQESVGELLNRVFDGEALSLMHHLVRDRGLTAEEAAELRKMLDEMGGADDD